MRIAVLTYHSNNVLGHDYADNDHVALAADLEVLARLRLPVLPLRDCVDALQRADPAIERAVALTFDDGSWFDWYDLPHPTLGPQRGFRSILTAAPLPVQATAFVIASPKARAALDRDGLIGAGWWGEDWWTAACREGLIAIENHSWDHNHELVPERVAPTTPPGSFLGIADYAAADAQIRQAADYLDAVCAPHRTSLFAYPYGEYSDYLVHEYLPRYRHEHRLRAAFTTEPRPLCPGEDRWRFGRYVCGQHWRAPGELERLLADALDCA